MEIPDKNTLQAISRSQSDQDYIIILEWLKGYREKQARLTNELNDENAVLRSQGSYRAIDHIVYVLENNMKNYIERKP